MATSRLERIGTIYSRIRGLLRSGALKAEDKPLWYDVYQNFPPKYAPKFERTESNVELTKLFYPEDITRAKIHREKSVAVGAVNLSDSERQSNTQRCLAAFEKLQSEGVDEVKALNEAVERVIEERGATITERSRNREDKSSIADEFKRSQGINVAEIMKKD